MPQLRLIRTLLTACENRHHDEPAVGQLIVAHDGIAVVVRFTGAAEALEQRVGGDGAVDDLAILPEDRHAGVDDLDDVVAADGKGVVGGVAHFPAALRSLQPDAQAVKARDETRRGSATLRRLFDGSAG
jgi:hypothetical protein